jgi:6-pyruvoyltetrahydropterin/6-carboxytetrahydropterin synthase
MLTITRSFDFCAGHRLYRPEWSDEKNTAVFGLCANPMGHGHNYHLDVTVTGAVDPETGMVMNLRTLKEVVTAEVIRDIDHRNLNTDVPWMKGVIPTTELLAQKIWERLYAVLGTHAPSAVLHEIVLQETPNNRVSIRKDR